MAERSITYVVGFLTLVGTVLSVPFIAMFYGFHEWTARVTGGIVDARFIALVDTALESPLGQIAMIPMLAWIARCAPSNLKATYFAVMASFTNLALSLSQLGTKYLNQIYEVTREVKDPATGAIQVAADYSQLGALLIAQTADRTRIAFCGDRARAARAAAHRWRLKARKQSVGAPKSARRARRRDRRGYPRAARRHRAAFDAKQTSRTSARRKELTACNKIKYSRR